MINYKMCTKCNTNFLEEVWDKNKGCLSCKWENSPCPCDGVGLVKFDDPSPCFIKNTDNILINGKDIKKW